MLSRAKEGKQYTKKGRENGEFIGRKLGKTLQKVLDKSLRKGYIRSHRLLRRCA